MGTVVAAHIIFLFLSPWPGFFCHILTVESIDAVATSNCSSPELFAAYIASAIVTAPSCPSNRETATY